MLALEKRAMVNKANAESDTEPVKGEVRSLSTMKDRTLGSDGGDQASEKGRGRPATISEQCCGRCDPQDLVKRSPIMLEFGPEPPGHAQAICREAQQLPFPDRWDDPEVNNYLHTPTLSSEMFKIRSPHC